MNLLPKSLSLLVEEFSKLPGVGERTALRYALFFLKRGPLEMRAMKKILDAVEASVSFCQTCFFWQENQVCALCSQHKDQSTQICVVRDAPDILALERSGKKPWHYHVLQGFLSPLNGVGPRQIRLEQLFNRLQRNTELKEVILAFDSTVEGDATAYYIKDQIQEHFSSVQLTRAAAGLPSGASVEYLDSSTLEQALTHRRDFQ